MKRAALTLGPTPLPVRTHPVDRHFAGPDAISRWSAPGGWNHQRGSAIPNNIWMTYTWLVMVWETCCHICWYWEIWMSSGQIIIIHSPELLGHLGMNPLQKPWFPGLGRIGFGRDEIYPGIFVWFWDILCVYTGITPYILWNAWTYIYILLYTGWWFQPLWKIWKSVGMIIPIYYGK